MSKALSGFLVLVLALPPAWCCARPASRTADPVAPAAQHSCCGHQSAPTSDESPAPTPIASNCCCQKDWKPSPTVEPVVLVALPVELLADSVLSELATVEAVTASFEISDPPLHILQCEWRC